MTGMKKVQVLSRRARFRCGNELSAANWLIPLSSFFHANACSKRCSKTEQTLEKRQSLLGFCILHSDVEEQRPISQVISDNIRSSCWQDSTQAYDPCKVANVVSHQFRQRCPAGDLVPLKLQKRDWERMCNGNDSNEWKTNEVDSASYKSNGLRLSLACHTSAKIRPALATKISNGLNCIVCLGAELGAHIAKSTGQLGKRKLNNGRYNMMIMMQPRIPMHEHFQPTTSYSGGGMYKSCMYALEPCVGYPKCFKVYIWTHLSGRAALNILQG